MKIKPVFVAIAAAVVGFAFITPDASALPPSKTPGGYAAYIQKKKARQEARQEAAIRETEIRAQGTKKTIGLAVDKGAEKRKLRPYFMRKRGGPWFSRR